LSAINSSIYANLFNNRVLILAQGHGRCVFVSKYDANVSVSECGVLDADCVPHCDCDGGYIGSSSCSLRDDEVLRAIEVRGLIVDGVGELMSRENVDVSNVRSWIKTLSLLGSDYLGLDIASKRLMSQLTIDILNTSRRVGLSIEELSESGIVKMLDMCVSAFSISSSHFQENVEDKEADALLLMSLLAMYSEFVTSDMLEAQNAVSSVTPYLRTSSFFLPSWHSSSTNPSTSSFTLSIPENALESLLNVSSHQSIQLSSGFVFPLQISISETLTKPSTSNMLKNDTNSSESVTMSPLSLPLFISLGSSPCNVRSGVDCLVRVMLQHKLKSVSVASSLLSTPTSNETSFEVDCRAGVVEDHLFACPSGEVLTISCNGSSSPLRGRRSCPTRSNSVHCQTRIQSSVSSPSEVFCELSDSNDSMTVCMCNLSAVGVGDGDTGSVSFSIFSVQRSVLTDFVSTWESAPSLSSGDVSGSWVVLVTLGGLGGFFVLMMAFGIHRDVFEKRSLLAPVVPFPPGEINQSEQGRRSHSRFMISLYYDVNHVHPTESTVAVNPDLQLLEESLPSIYKSNSLWSKFKEEMRVYHRWLGIIFHYTPEFPRSMRVLSLFSSIVIMLFVQSVTYNISDPDDGSCEDCDSESRCLSMRSTLNSRQARCYWESASALTDSTPESDVSGSCHFRQIAGDMTRVFIVALISAIVSAPFALIVQYLIVNVLSRETIYEREAEKQKQKQNEERIERSLLLRQREFTHLSETSEGSSDEDLKSLLNDLTAHYKYLKALTSVEQKVKANEFRGKSLSLSFSVVLFTFVCQIAGDLLCKRRVTAKRSLIASFIRWPR
jgi:hypothetical protein